MHAWCRAAWGSVWPSGALFGRAGLCLAERHRGVGVGGGIGGENFKTVLAVVVTGEGGTVGPRDGVDVGAADHGLVQLVLAQHRRRLSGLHSGIEAQHDHITVTEQPQPQSRTHVQHSRATVDKHVEPGLHRARLPDLRRSLSHARMLDAGYVAPLPTSAVPEDGLGSSMDES